MNKTTETLLVLAKKINETYTAVEALRCCDVGPSGDFRSRLDIDEAPPVTVLSRVGDVGLKSVDVYMVGRNERCSLYALPGLAGELVAQSIAASFETHVRYAIRVAEEELERLKKESMDLLVAFGRQ